MIKDEKETGGNAFPFTPYQDRHMKMGGMTLRDYFAGQAIISIMSQTRRGVSVFFKDIAIRSYALADAMLKERNK